MLSAADPFSAPDMTRDRPNEDPFARVATITVAIVGVGGSAVAGTAFALYKEVTKVLNCHCSLMLFTVHLCFKLQCSKLTICITLNNAWYVDQAQFPAWCTVHRPIGSLANLYVDCRT